MKKQFTTLMMLLACVFGLGAVTPGELTGMYLRGDNAITGGNWDTLNPELEFKYGNPEGTWIYLVLNNSKSVSSDTEFAIGPNGWAQESTLIAASGDQKVKADANGGYQINCYYGGGRNSKLTAGATFKAIRVDLPVDQNTYDFNNGKNPAFPTADAGCGTIRFYKDVPREIQDVINDGSTEAKTFTLATGISGNWNSDYATATYDEATDSYIFTVNIDTNGRSSADRNYAFTDGSRWIIADGAQQSVIGENPCKFGSNNNFIFPENVVITKIILKLNGEAGTVTLVSQEQEAGMSNYAIEVWNKSDNNAWDTSGGLYSAIGNAAKIDQSFVKAFGGKDYLTFKKISDEEAATLGRKFASDNYREGTKFAQESSTELYVIDFTTGTDGKGIYLEVPSILNMDVDNYEDVANRSTYKHVQPFYRSGIRFGFIDFSYSEGGGTVNDHMRFVKWGHAFRLNEISRPLNAFASYDSEGKLNGFTDDFGTASWNGYGCGVGVKFDNGETVFDHDALPFTGNGDWRNKRGDSRLLAEYNLWLNRIYLEVAEDGRGNKHFYLSFDGEYDLRSGAVTEQEYLFKAVEDGSRTNVTETPNIFTQYNVTLGEPAFQRFYNLNLDRVEELLGFKQSENEGTPADQYRKHTGIGNILYDLDFTAGYTSTSERTVFNGKGEQCMFNGAPFARNISVKGEDGKYYDTANNNAEITATTDASTLQATLQPSTTQMLFDPEEEIAPKYVHTVSTYNFPNAVSEAKFTRDYSIDYETKYEEFDLNAVAKANSHDNYTKFYTDFTWDPLVRVIEGKGTLPVDNYEIEVSGQETEDWTPVETAYTEWLEADELAKRNHEYIASSAQSATYNLVYNVKARHNWAYAHGAIYSPESLVEDAYRRPSAEQTVNKALRAGEPVYAVGDFSYVVRPDTHTGTATALFDEHTSAIETIGVDDNTAAARYYNLQGIEVKNPVSGQVYVMCHGDKAVKVLVP